MNRQADDLPLDADALMAALIAARAEASLAVQALAAARAQMSQDQAEIAHLKLQIAKLQRERFGSNSERTKRLLDQLEFQLEELEAAASADEITAETAAAKTSQVSTFVRRHPSRQPFPEHLPRERVVEPASCACPTCGSALTSCSPSSARFAAHRPPSGGLCVRRKLLRWWPRWKPG